MDIDIVNLENEFEHKPRNANIGVKDLFLPMICTTNNDYSSTRDPSKKIEFKFTGKFFGTHEKCRNLRIMEALPYLRFPQAPMFQDVFVEILHDGQDPDVYFRIYADGSENRIWSGFNSVSVKFCLMKPATNDYRECFVSLVKKFECENTCERIQCECKKQLLEVEFCGGRKLCSVNELLDSIQKKMVLHESYAAVEINFGFLLSRISFEFSSENGTETQFLSKFPNLTMGVSQSLGNVNEIKYDFALKCQGRLFHCHKFPLAENSIVLATMFQAGMTETATNEMTMEDTTCDAVEAFLDFVYTGNFRKAAYDYALAFELLQLGHRYEMEKLQNVMKELLIIKADEEFNLEAVLQIFAFCCKAGNLEDLKNKAVDMLKSNGDKIADLEGFGEFLKSDPNVVKELFKRMFS